MNKVSIAISACLIGQRVRYDGKQKAHAVIMDVFLKRYADKLNLIPFCPEVAIGLGVPRAKIQVVRQKNKQIRVLGVEDHTLDVTEALQSYAERFLSLYPDLRYCLVKSKSPSCGWLSTPIFAQSNSANKDSDKASLLPRSQESELGSGLFIQSLHHLKPELIIIEDTQLDSEEACLALLLD